MHNLGNCEGVFVEKFNIKYNNKYDIIFIKKKKYILKLVINTYRDNTSFFYSINHLLETQIFFYMFLNHFYDYLQCPFLANLHRANQFFCKFYHLL